MQPTYKIPVSALVVVHTPDLHVLLIERADFRDHWQSVTGSQEPGEALLETATRELAEETGIDADGLRRPRRLACLERLRDLSALGHRYPPGTTHNTEHVFGLEVPGPVPVRLAPREHLRHAWLPWQDAAAKCFSWSNRDAILLLPQRVAKSQRSPS